MQNRLCRFLLCRPLASVVHLLALCLLPVLCLQECLQNRPAFSRAVERLRSLRKNTRLPPELVVERVDSKKLLLKRNVHMGPEGAVASEQAALTIKSSTAPICEDIMEREDNDRPISRPGTKYVGHSYTIQCEHCEHGCVYVGAGHACIGFCWYRSARKLCGDQECPCASTSRTCARNDGDNRQPDSSTGECR